ncbi:MAG: three-Cys-motif partner protein TcmP [Deltaproteobacteria bacterium]|jgi:three-Cys-motif partner protein|nr:MAG: three-Cys-motif partner protein TcmP [Deltaproteobacteria bacterium]
MREMDNQYPELANAKLDEIGIWSEIKIAILREYACAFTRILKTKAWCRGCCYVDAFAGAGMHFSKTTREMVPGSPLNALLVEPRFDRIVLIDIDAEKVESLKTLCGNDKRVEILPGDCNEVLYDKVAPSLTYSSYWRGLCVLDPYGIHGKPLRWQTIKHLADLRTVDIFINFPLMDINRNTLRKDLANADDADVAAFSEFCGTEDWKDLMYQPDLFGEMGKIGNNRTIAEWFRNRLETVAGFKFVPEPILMQNSKGGPLYFLYFASHQSVAQKVVLDIFKKYRKMM